ncbi:hypothetical protein EYF80_052092 [Liparis tanakae]|uniref:Uncharacterized protein n=1 Tax=Liparis tanakae TaxID=230148 RepID=A0A4Z2FAD7_9TELE|nr:hypothetical protein EYF80_052092 [Liparis tanakae]
MHSRLRHKTHQALTDERRWPQQGALEMSPSAYLTVNTFLPSSTQAQILDAIALFLEKEGDPILYAEKPDHCRREGAWLTGLSSLQFFFGAPPDRNLAARKHKQILCGGLAGWAARFPPGYHTCAAQRCSDQGLAPQAQHPRNRSYRDRCRLQTRGQRRICAQVVVAVHRTVCQFDLVEVYNNAIQT